MTSTRLWLVRVGLPAGIALAGFVALLVGSPGLGLSLIGTAIVVVFANVLMRLAISGSEDHDREEYARRFFESTGRWPDEVSGVR